MGCKKGSGVWNELDKALRDRVLAAIDSGRDESARSIYNRFALTHRGIGWHNFRRIVSERRAEVEPVPETDEVPNWDELDRMMRRTIAEQFNAGNVKVYEAAHVITRVHDRKRLEIEQAAEERAARMFEVKVKRAQRELDALQRDGDGRVDAAEATRLLDDLYGLTRSGGSDHAS